MAAILIGKKVQSDVSGVTAILNIGEQ